MASRALWEKKTFWAGLGLIGFGVFRVATGNGDGVEQIMEGLGLIFLRAGISRGD